MQSASQAYARLVPDQIRIRRYQRQPENGPRILFFSGGSALRDTSQILKTYTHNSIHLLTPFDSGGSSATLRDAFCMPAVGDLRNRLVALADGQSATQKAAHQIVELRLPEQGSAADLRQELHDLQHGRHREIRSLPGTFQHLLREFLGYFLAAMPDDFDLHGACIGNLVLAGAYLHYGHRLEPGLHLLARVLEVRGTVTPVTHEALHLAVQLASGERIVGQHLITGKEGGLIDSPVTDCCLSASCSEWEPVSPELSGPIRQQIVEADLICYPPGSFYSSVIANLLVSGVGDAIARADSPKVYVPNLGRDPEQIGLSLSECVSTLVAYLRRNARPEAPISHWLTHILLDEHHEQYDGTLPLDELSEQGVQVVYGNLSPGGRATVYDSRALCEALLTLSNG